MEQALYPFLSHSAQTNLFCMGVASKYNPLQRVGESYTMPELEIRKRCAAIILEEALETIEALGLRVVGNIVEPDTLYFQSGGDSPNLEKAIDGACDLKFVCDGLLMAMGVPDVPHMEEVCRANTEKFPGGVAIIRESDGKYLKPEGWKPPNHRSIIHFFTQDQDGLRIDLRRMSEKAVKQAEQIAKEKTLFEDNVAS